MWKRTKDSSRSENSRVEGVLFAVADEAGQQSRTDDLRNSNKPSRHLLCARNFVSFGFDLGWGANQDFCCPFRGQR